MSKPNILIVLLDGCRADRLGCYGYNKRPISPNLDKLAQEGFVSLNNYATSNCTIPTVTSMMTGLYPCVHKASSTFSYYDGKHPYLTEILQDHGYYTFGIMNNLVPMSAEWGFIRGYDRFYRIAKRKNTFKESKQEQTKVKNKIPLEIMVKRNLLKGIRTVYPSLATAIENRSQLKYFNKHDLGGVKALEAFHMALAERDKSKPFFGYVNLPDTHAPYFVPNQKYLPSSNLMAAILKPLEFFRSGHKLNDADKEMVSYMYDTCVHYIDSLCGQMVQLLDNLKLKDNTILIFTSDHGGMLAEKNDWVGGKYHLFQPETKTALIMNGPGISGDRKRLSSAVDIFQTILDFSDISKNFPSHGLSLFSKSSHDSIILDSPPFPDRLVQDSAGLETVNFLCRVLIDINFNKIMYENGSFKYLFNVDKDPEELNNLINSKNKSMYENELINKYKNFGISDLDRYDHHDMINLPSIDHINPNASRQKIVYI